MVEPPAGDPAAGACDAAEVQVINEAIRNRWLTAMALDDPAVAEAGAAYRAVEKPCCEARLKENRPPLGLTKNCTPVHSSACRGVRCGTLVAWPPTHATT